jgi:4-amino-4-deoxy-L-arabinose transferase-like glycosyltransferase
MQIRNLLTSFLSDAGLRTRFLWPAVTVIAVFSYLYSLGGLHVPHIGDEAPYIQITRLTAEGGHWLPLETAEGLENTKPPLLFWLGILSTNWAHDWSLFQLRLPIVIHTFLTAGLVFLLAGRITGSRESSYLSALTFLGFWSTFQYGRPFLTNLPETLFVFSAFFLVVYFRKPGQSHGYFFWFLFGLLVGVACLYKSFVLVVPVGFSLSWLYLNERRWDLTEFLGSDALKISIALLVALACFSLWPALDPEPASVFEQFILEENLGKLQGEGYVSGLFSGPYPVWRIWLGHLVNAGAFALPLLYVVFMGLKRRAELGPEETALWIFVLSFLIVYTVPSQRQGNYLIPTTPALAILLGINWFEIKPRWFHLFNLPLLAILALLTALLFALSNDALPPQSYQPWQLALPVIALVVSAGALISPRSGRILFHLIVFLTFASFACLMAPLEGPLGKFSAETVEAAKGRLVFVPSHFISRYERHRFLLPGAKIRGYHPAHKDQLNRLLESRRLVAVQRPLDQEIAGPFQVFGTRLDVKTRQSQEEIWKILFERDFDLLLQNEHLIRLRR